MSAATVSQGFASDVIIQGNFTEDEVENLVDLINSGSLPSKLTEISSQTVGAAYGDETLQITLIAGIIGVVLIILFLLWVYRFAGFISSVSMMIYTFLVFLVFWVTGGVLTLPGIAALILGIGMAVDSNVITFARIKDELYKGKSLPMAFKEGTKSSFSAILDSNLTTLLVAIIMFIFGESSIKGFATMLIITVVITMFTMVWLTRILLGVFVKTNYFNNHLRAFINVRSDDIPDVNKNEKVKNNMIFRSQVIAFLRQKMTEMGFLEIQTPILCASSPEGARDYIVPSRKYKGKFYALPQAPQQYKQLLMVSGFDKYFQVAPCFRDEDARADRSPGEFYQLDFEMSFATQEDVFRVGEEVLTAAFEKFAPEGYEVTKAPYPIISYKQAMLEFGTDKPDLRNPLRIIDVTDFFQRCTFKPFIGKTVRAVKVHANMSKGFHEKLLKFATGIGMGGLGYLEVLEDLSYKGPIDKFIPDDMKKEFLELAGLEAGDTIFFMADKEERAAYFAGQIRTELGTKLDLLEKNAYRFCYINDFPMFEKDPETKKIGFTHNPFSMPQGGLEALNTMDPLDILAYQYDIVCNGVELSSGAVRNHDMQIMVKAFEIAGYDEEVLKEKFGALYNAFQFGAPPHAGMAPGIDRMIMLLRNEENIREIIPFPMSGTAQDLMCGAPNEVTEQQLREVHIKVRD